MNLKYTYTRLNVENYAACKLFYQDVLGFKVGYADDAEEYVELNAGEAKITIYNRARLKEWVSPVKAIPVETLAKSPPEARIVLTFSVSNLDEEIAQLKARGVALASSPCQYPAVEIQQGGLITACFCDPDGNLIEFEQFLS